MTKLEYVHRNSRDSLIPKIVSAFEPDETVRFVDPNIEHPERMIFHIDGSYLDEEETHIDEFEYQILQSDRYEEINELLDKPNKLRFLQSNHYNYHKTIDNILEHIDFLNSHVPIILSDEATEILHKGLYYNHGRDRNFRPIMIFKSKIMTDSHIDYDQAINATFYSALYVITNMMVPSKVENWRLIIDLDNLAIGKIPFKFTRKFVQMGQTHLKCRSRSVTLLNVTFGVRVIYKILSPFIDERIKGKLMMCKENTNQDLKESIHPSQLEVKYGGEASNLEDHWPPKIISDEYGYDPKLINEDILNEVINSPTKLKKKKSRKSKKKEKNPSGATPQTQDQVFHSDKIGHHEVCLNEVQLEDKEEGQNSQGIKTKSAQIANKDKGCQCVIF